MQHTKKRSIDSNKLYGNSNNNVINDTHSSTCARCVWPSLYELSCYPTRPLGNTLPTPTKGTQKMPRISGIKKQGSKCRRSRNKSYCCMGEMHRCRSLSHRQSGAEKAKAHGTGQAPCPVYVWAIARDKGYGPTQRHLADNCYQGPNLPSCTC